MSARHNGDVKVTLKDGDVVLRLDFNAIDHIEQHLGMGVSEFFARLPDDDDERGAALSKRFTSTAFLRAAFYAGLLWTVPDGEAPSFTERDIGRRMELRRLTEYAQAAMDLILVAYGVTNEARATQEAMPNRKTQRRTTAKKGKKKANPT